ncbi:MULTISPECIES: hypothetical protein [unclassified Arenibacter]|uniref:hypothetical protein n=1 Tax=unclassified Arenibacter TaxID=2615047 RepID=UPI000E346F01|nr:MULTISPECIES: hypothetical protein [unclassified Arenibacter]MCM4163262.1 hypothetical protein [Arenibacter sp. A80]RFT57278.1 hypothetical protein D0S24_06585 [Arenibacter sp. P308M17]
MKKFFVTAAVIFTLISCAEKSKIPVYAWTGGPGEATDQELLATFKKYKEKGIDGLMYNGGHDPETYMRVGKLVKESGMEFHTWIPTMVQGENPKLPRDLYAVNRNGESAYDKPAYVPYYKFLCPNKEGSFTFLSELYGDVAAVEEVDGIHLDYIRFPDVILAEGLWDKYGLVMNEEYPVADYCYCDKCVSDFKEKSGIDIKEVEDPSKVQEWKQYRYDLITNIVNRLAKVVHEKGKKINAAVFPGPSNAMKMVRQEWNKWDLDAFYPMNYNDFYLKGPEWVGEITKEEVASVKGEKPIYSGLFICPNPENKTKENDPENHGLLPSEIETAIRTSMENGATGICLFTPERMKPEHWAAFDKAIHADYSKDKTNMQ